ncbi:MAG: RluA family pseudouridine synthase [Patescibacteria group bacterium]|nr:RluA family pseudouridine synthase [Patescibacteria group bacterium]
MNLSKIKILFEDENVLVINKPANLVVHADGKTNEVNLCDWILKNYPKLENVGEPLILQDPNLADGRGGKEIRRPGIVHRLDRETSGVLIIAKTQESFLNLKQQFKNKQIEKKYRTFVWGEVKNKEGVIDRPIGRSSKDFRQWSAQRGARGKLREATTEYKVLKKNKEFSFLEINLKTGRTHQIRVHMKAFNYPVVGDRLYAPKREYALGFERVALHAFSIEFILLNKEKVKVEAPFPDDFEKALTLML